MECNAIITGLNENQNENLPLLVQNFFMHDLEMQESEVNNVWNHQTLQTRRSKDK